MRIITILPDTIQTFRAQWPASGLHNVNHITAAFDDNGDVIDYEVYADSTGNIPINGSDYDGTGALPALFADAQKNARKVYDNPELIGPIWEF